MTLYVIYFLLKKENNLILSQIVKNIQNPILKSHFKTAIRTLLSSGDVFITRTQKQNLHKDILHSFRNLSRETTSNLK